MFTGIIQSIGEVVEIEPRQGDMRLTVKAPDLDWSDVELGDSIASNGVCLTAVVLTGEGFVADVSVETLDNTTLRSWRLGSRVNLEKALTPSSRLGGHIVSGHVDGIGTVISRKVEARSERLLIEAPSALAKYISHKGSITVDGTSLTVNAVEGARFDLNIVPHTIKHTVIDDYKAGSSVNLEVDVIARYLERLLLGEKAATSSESALTQSFLADHGYT